MSWIGLLGSVRFEFGFGRIPNQNRTRTRYFRYFRTRTELELAIPEPKLGPEHTYEFGSMFGSMFMNMFGFEHRKKQKSNNNPVRGITCLICNTSIWVSILGCSSCEFFTIGCVELCNLSRCWGFYGSINTRRVSRPTLMNPPPLSYQAICLYAFRVNTHHNKYFSLFSSYDARCTNHYFVTCLIAITS